MLMAVSMNRFVPFWVVSAWWFTCAVLYISGFPIEYSGNNSIWVLCLYGAVWLAVLGGYSLALRRTAGVSNEPVEWGWPKWPLIGLWLSIALLYPTVSTYTAVGALDVNSVLDSQAETYQSSSDIISEGSESRLAVLLPLVLTSAFTMTVIPYYFSKVLRGEYRYMLHFVLGMASPLTISLLTGRDQQLGQTACVLLAVWLAVRVGKQTFSRWASEALIVTAVGASLVAAMSYRKLLRNDGVINCKPGQLNCQEMGTGVVDQVTFMFATYASQGLEGLSRALNSVWHFGGGYSHSPAARNILENVVGVEPRPVVTDQLSQFGWSGTAYWSTALAQVANDLPWVLVPLPFFFWAAILSLSWVRSVYSAHWLPLTVFSYSLFGLIYVPLNYQLGVSGPIYTGYIVLVAMFLVREFRSIEKEAVRKK